MSLSKPSLYRFDDDGLFDDGTDKMARALLATEWFTSIMAAHNDPNTTRERAGNDKVNFVLWYSKMAPGRLPPDAEQRAMLTRLCLSDRTHLLANDDVSCTLVRVKTPVQPYELMGKTCSVKGCANPADALHFLTGKPYCTTTHMCPESVRMDMAHCTETPGHPCDYCTRRLPIDLDLPTDARGESSEDMARQVHDDIMPVDPEQESSSDMAQIPVPRAPRVPRVRDPRLDVVNGVTDKTTRLPATWVTDDQGVRQPWASIHTLESKLKKVGVRQYKDKESKTWRNTKAVKPKGYTVPYEVLGERLGLVGDPKVVQAELRRRLKDAKLRAREHVIGTILGMNSFLAYTARTEARVQVAPPRARAVPPAPVAQPTVPVPLALVPPPAPKPMAVAPSLPKASPLPRIAKPMAVAPARPPTSRPKPQGLPVATVARAPMPSAQPVDVPLAMTPEQRRLDQLAANKLVEAMRAHESTKRKLEEDTVRYGPLPREEETERYGPRPEIEIKEPPTKKQRLF